MSAIDAAPPAASRTRLFRLILIAWLVVVFVGGALAAEWGARWYERNRSTPPDYFPQIYYHHQRLGYGLVPNYDYYGWFRINSLGFRGREFPAIKKPGTLRVICLGGSTTFDIGSIGKARPWPDVLESELRRRLGTDSVEVLNLGIPGSTSLDSLIDLQIRALALDPDVLVVYQGLNDFNYSTTPARPDARSDSFPLEAPPRSAFMRWLRMHSVLFAKTEGRIGALLSKILPGSGDGKPIDDGGKSLEAGLAKFDSNVKAIAAIARANHVPLVLPEVVLPFPQGAPADCSMCSRLSSVLAGIEPDRIKAMFGRYSAVLTNVAAQGEGVYPIATSGFVPSEDRYYHDPVHFGPAGSEVMGARMAEALEPVLRSRVGVGHPGDGETKLP